MSPDPRGVPASCARRRPEFVVSSIVPEIRTRRTIPRVRAVLRGGGNARHAALLILFAVLAVAWTWPVGGHLGIAIPGDPGDNYSFVWNLWWMRHVLATPGLAYFHTTYLFHPFGTSIANHPNTALPALIGATLLGRASPAAAQDLLLIAYVFANLAAMYALAWTLTRHVAASALAAVTFGLSPYVAVHLLGHFDLVAAFTIPLFALALHHAFAGSNRAAVAAGLTLAATAYIAYYHLVYECFFAAIFAIAWADVVAVTRTHTAPSRGLRRLRAAVLAVACAAAAVAATIAVTGGTTIALGRSTISATTPQNALTAMWLCVLVWAVGWWRPRIAIIPDARWNRVLAVAWRVGIVFVLAASPLLWQAAILIARGEYVSQQYGWRSIPAGIDLLAPLLGSPVHPAIGPLSRRAYAAFGENYIETVGWLGVVPLVLLLGTRIPIARSWRIVGAVFFVWALGPFLIVGGVDTGLKLPAILLRFLPFVANARMPGRAMVVVYAAAAVLIAMRLATSRRLRSPSVQWLLVALVVVDFWDAPLPMTALDRPAVYASLAAADAGAVCEVPLGIGDGLSAGVGSQDRRVLFYATEHQHPLVGGYIGRMPIDAAERYRSMAVAAPLLALSDGAAAPVQAPDASSSSPCRYLVVHRATASTSLLTYVESLHATRMAASDDVELYRLW